MHFLDIPKEVIDDSVLKYFKWNDLLRFRRVCKWTKGITDGYLWVISKRAPEIEINEGDKSLEAFIAMGIPTARIFLNNAESGYYFYKQIEEETQHKFLMEYGPHVQGLRVAQMTLCPFGRELDFIDGLKNLKCFEAGYFGHGKKTSDCGAEWGEAESLSLARVKEDPRLGKHGVAKIFKGLKAIKIGQNHMLSKFLSNSKWGGHYFLDCPQFQHASFPYDSTFQTNELGGGDEDIHGALAKAFCYLFMYIKERPNELYSKEDGKQKLEVYDFENYHHQIVPWTLENSQELHEKLPMTWLGSTVFLLICQRALKTGLKLMNVHPSWFCARFKEDLEDEELASPELGHVVVSLAGLDPCVMQLDMPNLTHIWIPSTSCCATGDYPRPSWPALKGMDISVDGKDGSLMEMDKKRRFEDINRVIHQATLGLFRFLFCGGVRTSMSEICIRFVDGKRKKEVTVPETDKIVGSCPNLKKIMLINWMGTNKQLVELWSGLLGLEEICLENCRELGNVGFVGEDVGNPVFLRLKNLKKLTLKGLDKMPKITDTLFCMVLSKVKLRELVVTSEEPVQKVTKKGINALLEGPFAETIERFTFRDWSVADVTAQEFQELGKKFRSYDLL